MLASEAYVMEVINPHDRFFRETLAHPGAIRDFLQYYLPADVVALIEPDSAKLMKDSFIDDDLRQHFADMLYKVTLRDKRNAYVYILYEHKSYPDPYALLQVMRYMVRHLSSQEEQPCLPLLNDGLKKGCSAVCNKACNKA